MKTPATTLQEALKKVHKWESALAAVMPLDFKDWHENSKEEWPDVAALVIKSLRDQREIDAECIARLTGEVSKIKAVGRDSIASHDDKMF